MASKEGSVVIRAPEAAVAVSVANPAAAAAEAPEKPAAAAREPSQMEKTLLDFMTPSAAVVAERERNAAQTQAAVNAAKAARIEKAARFEAALAGSGVKMQSVFKGKENAITTLSNGMIKMDTTSCGGTGLCGAARELVSMRNTLMWEAYTKSSWICYRDGFVKVLLRTGGSMNNNFEPALIGGHEDPIELATAMRAMHREDRLPPPAWLPKDELKLQHKTGFLHLTKPMVNPCMICCSVCCWPLCFAMCPECFCCTVNTFDTKIGPLDEVSVQQDAQTKWGCIREVSSRGMVASSIDIVETHKAVGPLGITGTFPDFGACDCGCTEIVSISVAGQATSLKMPEGAGDAVRSAVMARLTAPALGPEVLLRTYTSSHPLLGKLGTIEITNYAIKYEGLRFPARLFFLIPCNVVERWTMPLDKLAMVKVEMENSSSAAARAAGSLKYVAWQAAESFKKSYCQWLVWCPILMAALFWTVWQPTWTFFTYPWRMAEITFVTVGSTTGPVFKVKPAMLLGAKENDTYGLTMGDFVEDLVEVIAAQQDKNAELVQRANAASAAPPATGKGK